jgi:hypothetical protein
VLEHVCEDPSWGDVLEQRALSHDVLALGNQNVPHGLEFVGLDDVLPVLNVGSRVVLDALQGRVGVQLVDEAVHPFLLVGLSSALLAFLVRDIGRERSSRNSFLQALCERVLDRGDGFFHDSLLLIVADLKGLLDV